MLYLGVDQLLRPYCSSLVHLIGNESHKEKRFWVEASDKFYNRIQYLDDKFATSGSFTYQTTLIDLLGRACSHDVYAISYLIHIGNTISALKDLMPANLFGQLKPSARQMVDNFELEISHYKNPIGEFCFLLYMLTNPALPCSLIAIEKLIPNQIPPRKKKADFVFRLHSNNQIISIDVLNISMAQGKLHTEEDAHVFFSHRLQEKYDAKLGSPPIPLEYPFLIAPILWCDLEELLPLQSFFERFSSSPLLNGMPFFSIAQDSERHHGKVAYEFHTIPSLLKRLVSFI